MMREATFMDDWIQKGVEEGWQKGQVHKAREDILDLIRERFSPSFQQMEVLAKQLDKIESLPALKTLFKYAIHDASLADFLARLD